MYTKRCNINWILSWLLTLTLMIFSFSNITFAASNGTITISDVSYTTSTLSKGDAFSVSFYFYPITSSTDELDIKSVSVSGEAVDASESSTELTSGDNEVSKTSTGQIIQAKISGLKYTGIGSEVKISVDIASCTPESYTFNLKTMSIENSQGALILDSSTINNLSFSMNAGETKKFTLPIKNVTDSTIKNGVAKVYFDSTTVGLSITDGQYTTISSLNSGSTQNISFTVNATSAVKAGTYNLIVELNNMKQNISIAIDNDIAPPTLELSISENDTFILGEVNPLTINVKNVGGKTAKNIKITIQNDSDLAIVGSSNIKTINQITSGSSTSYISKIQLDSSPSSNLILLKLGLSYTDEAGESYSDDQTIYLNTNSVKNSNDLSITNITSPSGTYLSGQDFKISFDITSKYGAENVKISVIPDDNIIAKSQSVFMLSELATGASKHYAVTLAATDDIETGNHPIQILLEYDYQDKPFSMSQYASVNVSNDDDADDEDLTSPKVILSKCIATPQIVQAGQDVTIDFTFLNTHPTKSVYNLTATLDFNTNNSNADETTTSATSLFSTVSSSNTLFSSSLAPGASNSQSIVIGTSISATAASYNVYVDLSYEDEDGKVITSRETIPITISQDITIDVAQIDLSNLSIGRSTAMTATIYNTSKSDISNVMMYLESDALDTGFSVTDNKYYLSAFSMGSTEYYAPTLTGLVGGNYEVSLVIEYEDCLGEAQILRYPFQLQVIDTNANRGDNGEGMRNMGNMRPPNAGQGTIPTEENTSISPWIIGGMIVGLAALLLIIKKVVKKRKESKEFNIDE